MRFFQTICLAASAALAIAQTMQTNYINVPVDGFNAVAGQPLTLTWQDPSSSTVTIRLVQGGNTTPGSGILLASGIQASAETATFTIPTDVNQAQYNFEIIDDSGAAQPNFSSGFTIAGGQVSVSSTSGTATSTGTSSTSASASTTGTSSTTNSASSSASSSSSSASASASSSASSASSAASASSTTAPHSGAGALQAGGIVAVMAGAVAVWSML